MAETTVTSFILRFTHQEGDTPASGRWIGLVRHIQSGAEQRFVDLHQAVQFIEHFVPPQPEEEQPSDSTHMPEGPPAG